MTYEYIYIYDTFLTSSCKTLLVFRSCDMDPANLLPLPPKTQMDRFPWNWKVGVPQSMATKRAQPQASNYALAKTLHLYHHRKQKLTVVNSCEAKGKVERTHLHPPPRLKENTSGRSMMKYAHVTEWQEKLPRQFCLIVMLVNKCPISISYNKVLSQQTKQTTNQPVGLTGW